MGVCFLQDFGEYQESYYSVQTTEGEQISQLIAGYIDIILKKVSALGNNSVTVYDITCVTHADDAALQKQSKDRFGLDGDEESTMLEESVSPKKYAFFLNAMMSI